MQICGRICLILVLIASVLAAENRYPEFFASEAVFGPIYRTEGELSKEKNWVQTDDGSLKWIDCISVETDGTPCEEQGVFAVRAASPRVVRANSRFVDELLWDERHSSGTKAENTTALADGAAVTALAGGDTCWAATLGAGLLARCGNSTTAQREGAYTEQLVYVGKGASGEECFAAVADGKLVLVYAGTETDEEVDGSSRTALRVSEVETPLPEVLGRVVLPEGPALAALSKIAQEGEEPPIETTDVKVAVLANDGTLGDFVSLRYDPGPAGELPAGLAAGSLATGVVGATARAADGRLLLWRWASPLVGAEKATPLAVDLSDQAPGAPALPPAVLLRPDQLAVGEGALIGVYETWLDGHERVALLQRVHGSVTRLEQLPDGALAAQGDGGGLYILRDCSLETSQRMYAPPRIADSLMDDSQADGCRTNDSLNEGEAGIAGAFGHDADCQPPNNRYVLDDGRSCVIRCGADGAVLGSYSAHTCRGNDPDLGDDGDDDDNDDDGGDDNDDGGDDIFAPAIDAKGAGVVANGIYEPKRPSHRLPFYILPWPRPASVLDSTSFVDELSGNHYQDTLYRLPSAEDIKTWQENEARQYRLPTEHKYNKASGRQCDDRTGVCTYDRNWVFSFARAIGYSYSLRAYGLEASNIPVGAYGNKKGRVVYTLNTHLEFEIGVRPSDRRVVRLAVYPGQLNGEERLDSAVDLSLADNTSLSVGWTYSVRVVFVDIPYEHRHGVWAKEAALGWPWMELGLTLGTTVVFMAVFLWLQREAAIKQIVTAALTGPAGQSGASRLRRALYRRPACPELMAAVLGSGIQILLTMVTLTLVFMVAEISRSERARVLLEMGVAGLFGPALFSAAAWSLVAGFVAGVFYKLVPNRSAGSAAAGARARRRQLDEEIANARASAALREAGMSSEPPTATGGLTMRTAFTAKFPPWLQVYLLTLLIVPVPVAGAFLVGTLELSNLTFGAVFFGLLVYLAIAAPLVAAGLWAGRQGARLLARAARASQRSGAVSGPAVDDNSEVSSVMDGEDAILNDEEVLAAGTLTVVAAPTVPAAPTGRRLLSPFIDAAAAQNRIWSWLAAPVASAFGHDPLAQFDAEIDEEAPPAAEKTGVLWLLGPIGAALAPAVPLLMSWSVVERGIWGGPHSPPSLLIMIMGVCVFLLVLFGAGPVAAGAVLAERGERWAWPSLVAGVGAGSITFLVAVFSAPFSLFLMACASLVAAAIGLTMAAVAYAGALRTVRRVHRALLATAKEN